MTPSISVVVPTIGRPELLRALRSVRAQRTTAHIELIVVHDGEPGTELPTGAAGLADRVIRTAGRVGGSRARNIGIAAAAGDLVALLDDDDEKTCTVLKLCRSAMSASGRVIVVEPLVAPPNQPEVGLLDMTMLVMTGGRKRTLEEYSALFAEAGFRIERSIAKPPPMTILVGAPM